MKYRKYRIYKLFIVIVLALLVGFFVEQGNFIIPLIALLVAVVFMFLIKRNVDEIISDERINLISDKAMGLTFKITTILIAILGVILIALKNNYSVYYTIGNVFAFLACGMLILYSILFRYYSKKI